MFKLFSLIYIPLAIAITGLAYISLRAHAEFHLSLMAEHEGREVEVARHQMEYELNSAVSDLKLLANLPSLRHVFGHHNGKSKEWVIAHFLNMAREKRLYDQIRYLDTGGMEIVRVNYRNGKAEAVPDSGLQDKSDRYYFRESINLPKGAIYASPLDLNIEHGQVEIPYIPMLRLCMPVFDEAGGTRGLVVINYKGEKLLQNFRNSFDKHGMLLNSDGYWLSAQNPEKEWGFMFKRNDTFAGSYPAEWKHISSQEKGRLVTSVGMISFATVHPFSEEEKTKEGIHAFGLASYPWKIVSLVPDAELPSVRMARHPQFFAAYAIGMLTLTILVFQLASSMVNRRQLRAAIAENEAWLKEITAKLGEGLLALDAAGRVSFANPAAKRLLGWTSQELVGQCVQDFCVMPIAGFVDGMPGNNASRMIFGGNFCSDLEFFRRKDGTRFPVRITAAPIFRNGEAVGAVMAFNDITERKAWENTINAYVREIEDLYNQAPCGYHSLDDAGRIVQINQTELNWLGYKRNEVLGRKVAEFLTSSSLDEFAKNYPRFMQDGHIDNVEYEMVRKDGTTFFILLSAVAVFDNAGNYVKSRSTMIDITERKRRDEELGQARRELEELYDKAPCGYHSVDKDGRIIRINQTEASWLGYPRDELVGRKITEFYAIHSAEFFALDFPRFKREGDVGNIEVDLVRKDGSTFTALLSSTAVYDAAGNYVKNRTTLIDISKRKEMEVRLIDSETRFRQLFEKAPIGIAMVGPDQKIFMANVAYCRMFGYSQEELRHLTITDLTSPDFVDKTESLVAEALAGDVSMYSFEKKYLRKDGRTFWGRIIATVISGFSSPDRCIMGMVEDITERVEQEARRFIELNMHKDVLIREVHHRIKNNLQGVMGLLRQYAIDHPEMAGVVDAAIGKIYSIAIVHGLQAQTTEDEVDLAGLLDKIAQAATCYITFRNQLISPVYLCKDEGVSMALVLNELVTNACKHCFMGGLVTMTLRKEGHHIIVTIANPFDDTKKDALDDGQGLFLVRSLLPRRSARFTVGRTAGIFTAELELASPVVVSVDMDK